MLGPLWLKILLPLVGLVILTIAGEYVAPPDSCSQSNCQFNVQDDCKHSKRIFCYLTITKINITKTSFPEHVQDITISNVKEIRIEADAIASLASLKTIQLTNVGTLTLLPRSLARTNKSGLISVTIHDVKSIELHPGTFADWRNPDSKINIRSVAECHMLQMTFPPRTLVGSLQLVHINALTIDNDAFAPDSAIEHMMVTQINSMSIKTGAFAPNATVQYMHLADIKSLTLHSGAFALNSSIQNAVVDRVISLSIYPGGFQANISKLTFKDVSFVDDIITGASFPTHVRKITISNFKELQIEADAVVSLASLQSIELTQIRNLTLLPSSLVRTNESGQISVTINDVDFLQLSSETFADWRNSGSKIIIKDVVERNIRTRAFAPNTTVQSMQLEDIESLTAHTGAFARSSSFQNAVVKKVASLLSVSSVIQADTYKLTISNVSISTCEENTFGDTIQAMSLTSSHINLTKTGCISASDRFKSLLVENSTFDHIESQAIRGTIDQVEIQDSNFSTIETGGFTLNVTRFTMERSIVGELSEKALEVIAAEAIILNNSEIVTLRKHAFLLLQLNSSAEEPIRIENLLIQQSDNESLQIASGANVVVSQVELGVPCTCNMVLNLGLLSNLGHENDTKASRWLEQTRCVNNTTTPTLAEYHQEYCPDPTTTTPPITSTTTNKTTTTATTTTTITKTHTGSVSTRALFGTIIPAALMLIILVALKVHRQLQRSRSSQSLWTIQSWWNSDRSQQPLLDEPDRQPAERNAPHSRVTAEHGETESGASGARPADSGSRRYPDMCIQPFLADSQDCRPRNPESSDGLLECHSNGTLSTGVHETRRSPQSRPTEEQHRPIGNTQTGGHPTNKRTTVPGYPMGRRKNPLVQQLAHQTYQQD